MAMCNNSPLRRVPQITFGKAIAMKNRFDTSTVSSDSSSALYRNPDDDPRGPYMWLDATAYGDRPTLSYSVLEVSPPPGRHWRYSRETMERMVADGRVVLTPRGQIRLKRYLSESSGQLSRILKSIPTAAHARELAFTSLFIPEFVSALGYADSETLYDVGAMHADVVLAPAVGARPWIVIEIKNRAAHLDDRSLRQLRTYMLELGSLFGVIIGSSQIAVDDGETVELLNLADLSDADTIGLLNRLARWAQSENEIKPGRVAIADLIAQVETASTNQDKGRSLEDLASLLFSDVPSLHCKYRNLNTRSSEIDLVIEYRGSKLNIPLFDELGRYCFIECKNWSSPVGVAPVRDFLGKLRKSKTQLGILFAKNGITGEGTGLDALREIQSAYDRDGTFLLVFSLADIKQVKNGADFIALLDQKSDNLRFDL